MEKIEKILKKLSDLYEFNRKLQTYNVKETTEIGGKKSLHSSESTAGALIGEFQDGGSEAESSNSMA